MLSGNSRITGKDSLPDWFPQVLERDRELHGLWNSMGKPDHTDTSRSGYDYAVARVAAGRWGHEERKR